jgi:hypothetical protein
MKSTKLYWNGKRLKDLYVGATRWDIFKYEVRKAVRFFLIVSISSSVLAGIITSAFHLGQRIGTVEAVSATEVVKYVEKQEIPPIMQKIAKCESGGVHKVNGQVVINRTQDIGKYQIHVPIWGKKATEMGLDLSIEEDNEKFAMWLFNNYGSVPWVHSSKCWNK